MRTIVQIQEAIERATKAGWTFEKVTVGREDGCHCEVCGKNHAGVFVYAYPAGEKCDIDPMSQWFSTLGQTCFKKLKFPNMKKSARI